jgi:DNA-directed DNA polymerase III PolC
MSRVKEVGYVKAPICDRNSTFAFNRWRKLCDKNHIEPAYGVELGVTVELGAKKPILDYWRFMAKDDLRPLHDLVAKATGNPGNEPSLTYAQAMAADGLTKITGERVLLANVDVQEDIYIGLGPSTPMATVKTAIKRGLKLAAVSDNVYPREEDREFYLVMLGLKANSQSYPQHILTDEEWKASLKWMNLREIDLAAALVNSQIILGRCKAKMKQATLVVPDKPKSLREMCLDGAHRLGCDLHNPVYGDRLNRELSVIYEKNFEDYFYLLTDAIHVARTKMIVGPGRGSSSGSLVCYLLGITTIDPIPHDLIFERFIDITRPDMPDIDVDFSDARRHLVFEHIEELYGKGRIARLGSVGQFKLRSALKQAGVSLRISQWDIDKVVEQAASDDILDALTNTDAGRKMVKEYPEVMIATRMEDHPTTIGQHAAGVVITNEQIAEYVAINSVTGATMCDKSDAEDLGLLKIDALGLTQLSIFERCLDLIGVKDQNAFLNAIPTDDPLAFDVLNRGNFSGIFQFNGHATQGITRKIKVESLNDIVAITALARPGPLDSGGAQDWVKRRNGAPVVYPHPLFEPYMKDTLGVLIYQETVLKIGREIGELSWPDVTALRKAISKSMGKEQLDKYGDKWKAGALAKGIPAQVVDKFWDDICKFGAYAFNKAHSVAYGLVSYWCCYLKARHPVEFAAATMDAEASPLRQIQMLRELAKEGVDYVPVDSDHSTDKWEPAIIDGVRKLVGPLTNIEGIGPAAVIKILDARKKHVPLTGDVAKKIAEAKTKIDTLWPVRDAIAAMYPDLSAINIVSTPTQIIDVQPGFKGPAVVIARIDRLSTSDANDPAKVAKRRGRKVEGPTTQLNIAASDDTDEMLVWVDRLDYERLGKKIQDRGGVGKSLWVFKGIVPRDFRMLRLQQAKFLGYIDEEGRRPEEHLPPEDS